jgi:hypothetical protein
VFTRDVGRSGARSRCIRHEFSDVARRSHENRGSSTAAVTTWPGFQR